MLLGENLWHRNNAATAVTVLRCMQCCDCRALARAAHMSRCKSEWLQVPSVSRACHSNASVKELVDADQGYATVVQRQVLGTVCTDPCGIHAGSCTGLPRLGHLAISSEYPRMNHRNASALH